MVRHRGTRDWRHGYSGCQIGPRTRDLLHLFSRPLASKIKVEYYNCSPSIARPYNCLVHNQDHNFTKALNCRSENKVERKYKSIRKHFCLSGWSSSNHIYEGLPAWGGTARPSHTIIYSFLFLEDKAEIRSLGYFGLGLLQTFLSLIKIWHIKSIVHSESHDELG